MNLRHHFLVATDEIKDDIFENSVVYICEHNDDGTMGIIINKPSPIPMAVVFAGNGSKTPEHFNGDFIMMGGPVQGERGFVLHTPIGNWQSTLTITDEIGISTSRDVIEGLADNRKIHQAIVSVGYSSWEKGQLEQELSRNAWLVVPADKHILFDTPIHQKHSAALAKLGINQINLIKGIAHA